MTPNTPESNHGSPPNGIGDALQSAIRNGDTRAAAHAYRALGLSNFPVKVDGSKTPVISGWRAFADRLPTAYELNGWHAHTGRQGIGIPGGAASGNLAVLDFELWAAFCRWGRSLEPDNREVLRRCPVIGTPKGGAHVYCRLVEPVKGCKLARSATGETVIEVRGCQHYVVAPGSPAACHPLDRAYRLLRPGWLDGGEWGPMPLDAWFELTLLAAERNEYRKPCVREVVGDRSTSEATGDRPGDHFNARVGWGDILGPHGWTIFRSTSGTTYWTRPGKKPGGVSASTGFCKGPSGSDLLYVFSSSAAPFEAEVSYSRFAAYALLNHHGDFIAATRTLGAAGYGNPRRRAAGKGVR